MPECTHATIINGKCKDCGAKVSVAPKEIETADDLIEAISDRVIEKMTANIGGNNPPKKGRTLLDSFLKRK